MPVTRLFREETLRQLNDARPVRDRAMFGGIGYYCDDAFFAIADDDRLYFKVDELNLSRFEELGMEVWNMGGNANTSYREVPLDIRDNPELLGEWIDSSVEVARRKKPSKKR